MKHYRIPFFTQLHSALQEEDIELVVTYSPPNRMHALRTDSASLPVEFGREVRGYWFADRLLYQPLWSEIRRADLVITGQENKYLINLWIFFLSVLRLKQVAFWGLGECKEEGQSSFSRWLRDRSLGAADWYFAYTKSIVSYLEYHGLASNRVTVVQNSTDTAELRRKLAEITEEEVLDAKRELTGDSNTLIGLYCGALSRIKDLPFLLESSNKAHRQCPNFHLVIMGNGPERAWVEKEVASQPWVHYVGSKYGREAALYYKMANLFLLGGTAGLAVVDSFAAGLPLIATELPTHPPEVSYLCDGQNGRLTPHDPDEFARAVVELLSAPSDMLRLREGAAMAGSKYTMEVMVRNFKSGVMNCLATSQTRRSVISRTFGRTS
jgi:L-malate glycosyltransferase